MTKKGFKNLLMILSTSVSLLAVFVCAVTTFSWFQIQQEPSNTIVSGSPDLNIENVTGYKVEHYANSSGNDDFDPESILVQDSTGEAIIDDRHTNEGNTKADVDYDIPSLGDGYYVIHENNDSYKYQRNGSGNPINYSKFTHIEGTTKHYVTETFTAGEAVKIGKYTFENGNTINKQLKVGGVSPSTLCSKDNSGYLVITAAGTYTVWLDSNDITENGAVGNKTYEISNVTVEQTTSSTKYIGENPVLPKGLQEESQDDSSTPKVERKARRNANENDASVISIWLIDSADNSVRDSGWNVRFIDFTSITCDSGYSVNDVKHWFDNISYTAGGQSFSFTTYTGNTTYRIDSNTVLTVTSSNSINQSNYNDAYAGHYHNRGEHRLFVLPPFVSSVTFKAHGHNGSSCEHNASSAVTINSKSRRVVQFKWENNNGNWDNFYDWDGDVSTFSLPRTAIQHFNYANTKIGNTTYNYKYTKYTAGNQGLTALNKWCTNSTRTTNWTEGSYTDVDSLNLYAVPSTYSITYLDKDGEAFSGAHQANHPTTHTYGTATTLKSASKAGYRFDGWFTTSGCTGSAVTELGATSYTSDITLYAKWTAIPTYTVTIQVAAGSAGRGSVSPTSVANVPENTTIIVGDGTNGANIGQIIIGNTTVTATPNTKTYQYTYAFDSWTVPSATVTSAMTITASFSQTTNTYTLSGAGNNFSSYTFYSDRVDGTTTTTAQYGTTVYYKATGSSGYKNSTGHITLNESNATLDKDLLTAVINCGNASGQTYTVTFDKRGGSDGDDDVTATYAADMPSITAPTRTGFTFLGYFDNTSGGTKYYNTNGTTARTWNKTTNTTLYAQWQRDAGWYLIGEGLSSDGGSTYSTAWEIDQAIPATQTDVGGNNGIWSGVTFEEGAQFRVIKYNANGTITWESTSFGRSTRADTENGWFSHNGTNFIYELTDSDTFNLYFKKGTDDDGVWISKSVTWTVYPSVGSTSVAIASGTESTDTPNFFPVASPGAITGYTFSGNYNKDAINGSQWSAGYLVDDTDFYAVYTPNVYTVNYYNGYGTSTQAYIGSTIANQYKQYTYGVGLTLPIVTREGYTFGGWYTNTACTTGPVTTIGTSTTGVKTFYAKWTPEEYVITYKDKGGNNFSGNHGEGYPTNHTYGTETQLVPPTKAGSTFKGWFTDINCEGDAITVLSATGYTDDITLYAKWLLNPTTSKTYYIYDADSCFGTPNAYLWDNAGQYETANYPGIQMTRVHDNLYKLDSYAEYDRIKFSNSDNSRQSSDITINSLCNAYDYKDGSWYNVGDAGSDTTYYIYDPNNYLGNSTFKAYYWCTNNKYDLSASTPEYPGTTMTKHTGTYDDVTPDVDRLYKITIGSNFTHIKFNGDTGDVAANSTIDLGLSGQAGRVFVITNGSGASLNGAWTDGIDCFYLQVDNAVVNYTGGNTGWTHVKMRDSGGTEIFANLDAFQLSTGFYKVYFRRNYIVDFTNANTDSDAWNRSITVDLNTRTSNYLYIANTTGGVLRQINQLSANEINIGVAKIYVKPSGGAWTEKATMVIGDIAHYAVEGDRGVFTDYFVYELGLDIEVGSQIKVEYVTGGAGAAYNLGSSITFSTSSNYNPTYRDTTIPYISVTDSAITTRDYEGTAKFNFYIYPNDRFQSDFTPKLSIAMVPKLGNGYYIMPYVPYERSGNNYWTTEGYINGYKMYSSSNTSATYTGFHAKLNEEYFIRSYVDAVDNLVTRIVTCEGVALTQQDGTSPLPSGVFRFTTAGYYTIETFGTSVVITNQVHDAFFAVCTIDPTKITSQNGVSNSVRSRYTSLVLKVSFKLQAVNSFDLNLSLVASIPNSLRNYIGVQFFVGDVGETSPYTYMRDFIVADEDEDGNIDHPLLLHANLANLPAYVIDKGTLASQTLYAYIIIDYVYSNNFSSLPAYSTDRLSFMLNTSYSRS